MHEKNQAFGLTEFLVAASLVSIVSYGIMSVISNANKQQRGIVAKDAMREFSMNVRNTLTDANACFNTFGGYSLSSAPIIITSIKDGASPTAGIKYATGVTYADVLTFKEVSLQEFVPDSASSPFTGTARVNVYANKLGDTGTGSLMHQTFSAFIQTNAVSTIVSCNIIGGSGSGDSLWDQNANNIFYSLGNVGIATSSPAAELSVAGDIFVEKICDFTGGNCRDISAGWEDETWGSNSHLDQVATRLDSIDAGKLSYRFWRSGGVIDSFSTTTGIDLSTSVGGQYFTGYIEAISTIDLNDGTPIGNMSNLVNAFDGNLTNFSRRGNTPAYIGIDLGAGNEVAFNGFKSWGSAKESGYGCVRNGANPLTLTMEASNISNFSALATIGSVTFYGPKSALPQDQTYTNTTPYRYYRIKINCPASSGEPSYMAEVDFKMVAQDMNIYSQAFTATTSPASAAIVVVMETGGGTVNTDFKAYVSRNNGGNWTQATLVDKGQFSSESKLYFANLDLSSQPAGTQMRWRFESLANKSILLHGVSLQW